MVKCRNCKNKMVKFVDEGMDDENEYYQYKYQCDTCGCIFVEQYSLEFCNVKILGYTNLN